MINRREFLLTTAAMAALSKVRSVAAAPTQRPNVLFILADDLGYGDLSCYGRPDYRTPVLDQLARQGTRFVNAYSGAPVCTPTRCAFVTGRYAQRTEVGLYEPLTRPDLDKGLLPEHPTVASLLKASGYETALIGKWHLGWKPEFGPNGHGFDEFFGVLSGAEDYFTHTSSDGGPDLWENLARIERTGYLTDLLSERAVQFLRHRRKKPFYLSLHYTAPHAPWEGPGDSGIDHTVHGGGPMTNGGSLKIYASMMRSLDNGIGRVLQALRETGLERNTLVIFTSDNGGERFSYNWPFSSEKGDLWEGGIHVPAIVRWPGVVRINQTTEQVATTMDWTATILAASRTNPDPSYPLDGIDLLPFCSGNRSIVDRTLFWRTRRQGAARMRNWKYITEGDKEYLFDLAVDPGEKVDLRTKQSAVFADLKNRFRVWNDQMLPYPPRN